MKEFRRSTKGLNNQSLFFDVDHVVYVEGGISYSKELVLAGAFNENTNDVHFWQYIFSKMMPQNRLKFKSVGSKSTLLELAQDVVNGGLPTIYIAMDSEFDEIYDKKIKHKQIFYTHGYSFENDIWNAELICEIIAELSPSKIEKELIQKVMKSFFKDISEGVKFDGYLFARQTSFFPRKGGILNYVDLSTHDFPKVNRKKMLKTINDKGVKLSTIINYGYRKKITPEKFCYGHLLADYSCHVIAHYFKKIVGFRNGFPNEYLNTYSIKKHFNVFFNNSKLKHYYMSQFNL